VVTAELSYSFVALNDWLEVSPAARSQTLRCPASKLPTFAEEQAASCRCHLDGFVEPSKRVSPTRLINFRTQSLQRRHLRTVPSACGSIPTDWWLLPTDPVSA
jgi:hypothetical protein